MKKPALVIFVLWPGSFFFQNPQSFIGQFYRSKNENRRLATYAAHPRPWYLTSYTLAG